MTGTIYDLGDRPPLGMVPEKMHAWTIRAERFGEPTASFQQEMIEVPSIAADEVLVYVMAAGVNYNNVWAALGVPVDVIKARNRGGEPEDFHIGGSDASGIVYKVGKDVRNVKVGDEVVIHCGTWSADCPFVRAGQDPMYSPTFRIWGYETNFGSFAQFTRVQAHQCLPKPKHLSWESAASYMLVGATAYRMLFGWGVNTVRKGDVVLVWGGAGGLGSMAIQMARAKGAVPIAVVSSEEKFEYCMKLGAEGCINRKGFDHWGMLPHWKDNAGYAQWVKGARAFGKAIWDILGDRRNPSVVFEHPGESTIPTSIFVCETGGMVVICAGTTGYNATVDLRYLWMRQKRLQGSHFANDEQAQGINRMVIEGHVDPCLSQAFTYAQLPDAHQLMYENRHPHGNMAILINATEFGQGSATASVADVRVETPTVARDDRPARYLAGFPALPTADDDGDEVTLVDSGLVSEMMREGVITCRPEDTMGHVIHLLDEHNVGSALVVDAQLRTLGVISQTDLVIASQTWPREALIGMPVERFFTPGCETCDADAPLSEAIAKMTRLRIHRLFATRHEAHQEKVVGIVSMTDIARRLVL